MKGGGVLKSRDVGALRLAYSACGLATTLFVSTLLAGCAPTVPMPVPTADPSPTSSVRPTPVPSPTASAPLVYLPNGTAKANQPYFDFVNQTFFNANGISVGESIVDNLVAAGFDKRAMEVTYDRTELGLAADSIVVSVRIGNTCLIGQVSSYFGYKGVVAPMLGSGVCLVGQTRKIHW